MIPGAVVFVVPFDTSSEFPSPEVVKSETVLPSEETLSRPKVLPALSSGVIGDMIKKQRIINVISTKLTHEISVIFVDFFRFAKKSLILLIDMHSPKDDIHLFYYI